MIDANQGEQLLNLSIQILNTGIQAFNTGKNHIILSIDNYYNQLKNISNMINSILDEYNNNQMKIQIMQNQMVQQAMMNQQMLLQQQMNLKKEYDNTPKINISFNLNSNKINIACNVGTKFCDSLTKFEKRMLKSKCDYLFISNGMTLNYDDERKVEELSNGADILIIDTIEK